MLTDLKLPPETYGGLLGHFRPTEGAACTRAMVRGSMIAAAEPATPGQQEAAYPGPPPAQASIPRPAGMTGAPLRGIGPGPDGKAAAVLSAARNQPFNAPRSDSE
jgi:hypothetical protein